MSEKEVSEASELFQSELEDKKMQAFIQELADSLRAVVEKHDADDGSVQEALAVLYLSQSGDCYVCASVGLQALARDMDLPLDEHNTEVDSEAEVNTIPAKESKHGAN